MRLDNAIWFEKFRPKTLEAMALPEDQVEAFQGFINDKDIPHLLLIGGPGSGKTTLAQILTRAVEGSVLSLNASSKDRGIETVRTKIKTFAQSKQIVGTFKIVFLDEADYMTSDAQAALRNTMETYSKHCRFILTANYADKIIGPLKSRCRIFHFNEFPKDRLIKLLNGIVRRELITVPKEAMEKIVDQFYPDIRTTINELQNACSGRKFDIKKVKALNVDLRKFGVLLKKGKLYAIREMLVDINDYQFVYKWLFDVFIKENDNELQNMEMADQIVFYMNSDVYTPDKEINFTGCLIAIMRALDIKAKF